MLQRLMLALLLASSLFGQAIGDNVLRPVSGLLTMAVDIEDGNNAGTFTAIDTTARFDDSGDINFAVADGGAGGPDVITATIQADSVALGTDTTGNYVSNLAAGLGVVITGSAGEGWTPVVALETGYTLAGNPTFGAEQCAFTTDGTASGGFLCEGTTDNTNEQLYLFPASDGADTTNYIALAASDGDALAGDSATAFFDTGQIETDRIATTLTGKTLTTATLTTPTLDLSATDPTTNEGRLAWNSTTNVLMIGEAGGTDYAAMGDSAGAALSGDSATSFFSTGQIEAARLPTSIQTDQFCYTLFDTTTAIPNTADIPSVWMELSRAITITGVSCEADAGSPTVMLQRDDGTPANILTGNITCGTTPTAGTIDTNEDNIAIGDEIDHLTVSGSTAKRINVCVKYTID